MDDASPPIPATTPQPPRRWPWWLLIVIVMAMIAMAAWQWRQTGLAARHAFSLARRQTSQIAALQGAINHLKQDRIGLGQRLADADAANRSLRQELEGLRERTRTVEDAVAALSEVRNGGDRSLRLDEAGFLLRMAKERYELFHDAAGSLDATRLAAKALAGIADPAYAPLQSDVHAAVAALESLHASDRPRQLDTLTALRAQVWTLPRASSTPAPGASVGWLARVGQALAGLVRIRRINRTPLGGADGELLRGLLAMDLANAQSALLAWDGRGYANALHSASTLLQRHFDMAAPACRSFVETMATLRPLAPTPLPQVDTALTEVNRVRALEALRTSVVPGTKPRRAPRR